jgi:hypothetical protein
VPIGASDEKESGGEEGAVETFEGLRCFHGKRVVIEGEEGYTYSIDRDVENLWLRRSGRLGSLITLDSTQCASIRGAHIKGYPLARWRNGPKSLGCVQWVRRGLFDLAKGRMISGVPVDLLTYRLLSASALAALARANVSRRVIVVSTAFFLYEI